MAKQELIIEIPSKRCLIAGLCAQIARFDGGRVASDQLRMQMNKQVQTVEAGVFQCALLLRHHGESVLGAE